VRWGGQLAVVPGDLLPQVRALSLQHGDPLLHGCVVLVEQVQALGEAGLPATGKLGVPVHLGDWHASLAQAAQYAQPFNVLVAETAVPAGCAVDAVQQPDPLVLAQGVEAEPGLLGGLAGGEDAGHARQHDTWSVLQVNLLPPAAAARPGLV
jgi:hypothetical protein